jgi:hypothetical protein
MLKRIGFLNLMQGMTRMTAILTAGGFVGGGVVNHKVATSSQN